MRALRLMIAKDLRVLLRRSPGTVLALVGYPLLVAALVALALGSAERAPRVALVNLDTSGRTVLVGDQRLSAEDYAERLSGETNVTRLGEQAAADALEDGRVGAVLTIPEGFVADLQSGGARPPRLLLTTSRSDPIAAAGIERRVESALFEENRALSDDYIAQVRRLVRILVEGGSIQVFGQGGNALGLDATRDTIDETQQSLREVGQDRLAEDLEPLARFVDQTARNLTLAGRVAESIGAPIELEVRDAPDRTEPVSAFGLAAALTLALGLAAALLGAGLLGSERDDGTLGRLLRGPTGPFALVGAKMLTSALLAGAVGVVVLIAVDIGTDIAIDRWLLWLPAVALGALAFAGLGAAFGALASDGRSALLMTLMIGLPLIFLGIVPLEGRAEDLLQTVGVAPVFAAFRDLLVEPSVPARLWSGLALTAASALALWTAGALVLRRRATT
jgi:ABC-type transport system involved in cytochrome c biogenesis permease component